MKILITGGSGFIAQRITDLFANVSSNVIYLVSRSIHKDRDERRNIVRCSYNSISTTIQSKKLDLIIHCASATPSNCDDMSIIFDSNINLSFMVSDYINTYKPNWLVFLSSVSVYGNINEDELRFDSEYRQPNKYGLSKLLVEELLKSSCKANKTTYVGLRIPGTVGRDSKGNIISKIANHLCIEKEQKLRLCNRNRPFNNILTINPLFDFISSLPNNSSIEGHSTTLLLASIEPIPINSVIEIICNKLKVNSCDHIEWYKSEKSSFSIDIDRSIDKGFNPLSTEEAVSQFCDELSEQI